MFAINADVRKRNRLSKSEIRASQMSITDNVKVRNVYQNPVGIWGPIFKTS